LDSIKELNKLGYDSEYKVKYINYEDSNHGVQTWGRAMPGIFGEERPNIKTSIFLFWI